MSDLETRFSKIDDAIQRLAIVSADLSKMLAVQEHRLNQCEKNSDNISKLVEKRRDDVEDKFKEVYTKMHTDDISIIEELKEEIKKSRTETARQNESLCNEVREIRTKVTKLEKMALIITGSAMTVAFLLGLLERNYRFFLG
jgi:DNA repair exonuclease SbcCD ATPase subunit